jgi:hypothetical protein
MAAASRLELIHFKILASFGFCLPKKTKRL